MNSWFGFVMVSVLMWLSASVSAQQLSVLDFEKEIGEIWMDNDKQMQRLAKEAGEEPTRQETLDADIKKVFQETIQRSFQASIKYLAHPDALSYVYGIRTNVHKDSLQNALNTLNGEQRISEYAMLIQQHIDTDQIEHGDRFCDFEAVDLKENEFRLSLLDGKSTLLIYGGLDCMGAGGRNYLQQLYDATSRETFEIVVFCPVDDIEKMQAYHEQYPVEYILISDFLLDRSPMKIKYGAQATPTCFFINTAGIVDHISSGLPIDFLNKFLATNRL